MGEKIDEVFILIVTRLTTNLLHVFVFEKQNVFVISVSPPSQDMLGPRSPINYDQATEDMVSTHIMTQHKRKILTLDQQQDSLLQSNLLKVCRAPKYFQKLIFSLKTLEIGKCLQRQQNATVLNASPFISANFAQF